LLLVVDRGEHVLQAPVYVFEDLDMVGHRRRQQLVEPGQRRVDPFVARRLGRWRRLRPSDDRLAHLG
jgi:hypothetical protein